MKNHKETGSKGTEAKMAREPAITKHMDKGSGEAASTIQNPSNPKRKPENESRTAEIARNPVQKP